MREEINAQIDREVEIAQAIRGNTFKPKRLEGSPCEKLPIRTSTLFRKLLSDWPAILLGTFSLSITLMWVCFLAWIGYRTIG